MRGLIPAYLCYLVTCDIENTLLGVVREVLLRFWSGAACFGQTWLLFLRGGTSLVNPESGGRVNVELLYDVEQLLLRHIRILFEQVVNLRFELSSTSLLCTLRRLLKL